MSCHCHQFFRTCGVNGHGVVQVLFPRPHPHGHRKALQHFIRATAEEVTADNALILARADTPGRARGLEAAAALPEPARGAARRQAPRRLPVQELEMFEALLRLL